jgi:hypothetical protein
MRFLKGTSIVSLLELAWWCGAMIFVTGLFLFAVMMRLREDTKKRKTKKKADKIVILTFIDELKRFE